MKDDRKDKFPLKSSSKIRDLFKEAGYKTDRFNKWRILGRAAIPGKNLTFSSYSQTTVKPDSGQTVLRRNNRLKDWIKENIYKEKSTLKSSRTFGDSPKGQDIILYVILSPEGSSITESIIKNGTAVLIPNIGNKQAQRELEDEETYIEEPPIKSSFVPNSMVFRGSLSPGQTGVRNRNKFNIGKKYARLLNDESSGNDTEVVDVNQDWLNTQWIYINSVENNTMPTTTIPSRARFFPFFPRATTTTEAPVITTANNTDTNSSTEDPNNSNSTKKPEEIQNMPTTEKPWDSWDNTHDPWDTQPWYPLENPWKMIKWDWNPPKKSWKMPIQTWNLPNDPWKMTKQPWNHPHDPWKIEEQPWKLPNDPWKRTKQPWNYMTHLWKMTKMPWNPPNDPWKREKHPWSPPMIHGK
ncbi:hypothetical protein CDAR_204511 [Caerostris darwini]|uniref:Uncharacterized protein n=1 Tax=Caerostris darwini TaxID=1538125 RepID=A0AAV4R2H7_9ARAC|nr:hypothetical protein CDAR_204511 [Caerostris darwini]